MKKTIELNIEKKENGDYVAYITGDVPETVHNGPNAAILSAVKTWVKENF